MYYKSLDIHLAKNMLSLCAPSLQSPVGYLLCRLLSFQIRMGHVCLDLEDLPSLEFWPRHSDRSLRSLLQTGAGLLKAEEIEREESLPQAEKEILFSKEYLSWLESSPIVTSHPESEARALVWKKPRLYFYRYYAYERKLAQRLLEFSQASEGIPQISQLKKALEDLYPISGSKAGNAKKRDEKEIDRQKLAAILSCIRPFLIITGGPGTGKTSTVAKILELQFKLRPKLRVALSAPTGKAAMRMQQALKLQREPEKKEKASSASIMGLDLEVFTLHRLLGQSRDGLSYYYNEKRQLDLDLLIIDEASMLDLSLLVRTISALKADARLILLGDHHQLASVESGAVMGELCSLSPTLNPSLSKELEALVGAPLHSLASAKKHLLTNNMVFLEKNFRFGEKSGIFALTKNIRESKIEDFMDCLQSKKYPDLNYHTEILESPEFEKSIYAGFASCFAESRIENILKKLQHFCVLSPFRKGPGGSQSLNQRIYQILIKKGFSLDSREKGSLPFYPILICQNDYELGLFNGDMGILYGGREKSKAYFLSQKPFEEEKKTEVREIAVELLPPYEMSFAMTVHRSQGSEFQHALLYLPSRERERGGNFISKEILYTALSRARKEITLFASEESLKKAIVNSTKRNSGLLKN